MNRKAVIGIIAAVTVAAAGTLTWRYMHTEGAGENTGPSDIVTVTPISELNESEDADSKNYFSGVVESQETWSVQQNSENKVKEIFVSVGDEVHKGDKLFEYDVEKAQTDQEQLEIAMERSDNEYKNLLETIAKTEQDYAKAKAADKPEIELRARELELSKKQKELEMKSQDKQLEKLKEAQKDSVVVSQIDGVVQRIRQSDESSMNYEEDNSFIKIMKTGDLQIKGTINEQNIGQITVGNAVLIHSRTDKTKTWNGSISSINTESPVANQNAYSGTGQESSNYNFYVTLDNSEGLMIGQHVYMETTDPFALVPAEDGLWIPSDYIAKEGNASYVWTEDENGLLKKQSVTVGESSTETGKTRIQSGLTGEENLAMPSEELTEGQQTTREE